MWIAHHWRLIAYCLMGWVILSIPLGMILGRLSRKMGDAAD